jgi:hypothetical protein
MVQWDPFMYWTIPEGGAQYGNAMPAFKNKLSKDDIWQSSVTYRPGCHRTPPSSNKRKGPKVDRYDYG